MGGGMRFFLFTSFPIDPSPSQKILKWRIQRTEVALLTGVPRLCESLPTSILRRSRAYLALSISS